MDRLSCQRRFRAAGFVSCFAMIGLATQCRPASAAVVTWDNGGGTQSWGAAANWNPDGLPAAVDTVTFTNAAANSLPGTTTNALDISRTVGGLTVQNGPTSFHTLDLAGQTLTVNGNVNVNTNFLDATLYTVKGGAWNIGSASNRFDFNVARNTLNTGSTARATVDLSTASVNFFLNNLIVGQKLLGGGGSSDAVLLGGAGGSVSVGAASGPKGTIDVGYTQSTGGSVGNVDLSNLDTLSARLSRLYVGVAEGGPALGRLRLADISVIEADTVRVGQSSQGENYGDASLLWLGQSTTLTTPEMIVGGRYSNGQVQIDVGGSLQLGSAAVRTNLIVGQLDLATDTHRNATMDLSGATFNAELSQLIVATRAGGFNASMTAALTGGNSGSITIGTPSSLGAIHVGRNLAGGPADGTVNLSGQTSLTADVNELFVGVAEAGSAHGQLTLAKTNTIRANSIRVGYDAGSENTAAVSLLHFGDTNNVTAGEFMVGGRYSNGQVRINSGGTLNLGTAAARTDLIVGRLDVATDSHREASLDLTGAAFNAQLRNLIVGERSGGFNAMLTATVRGGTAGDLTVGSSGNLGNIHVSRTVNGNSQASVDLSGQNSLTADLDQLWVGTSDGGTAYGTLLLPKTNVIHANSIRVGYSNASEHSGAVSLLQLGTTNTITAAEMTVGWQRSHGQVTMPAGGTLNLGTLAQPTRLAIMQLNAPTAGDRQAMVDLSGGTFNAVLSGLVVGEKGFAGSAIANGTLRGGTSGNITLGSAAAPADMIVGHSSFAGRGVGTVDLGGQTSLTANLDRLWIGVAEASVAGGVVTLAQTNHITANQILVGNSAAADSTEYINTLNLGANNTILAANMTIGGQLARGLMTMPAGGTLNVGSAAQRTNLYVGRNNINGGSNSSGAVDLTGGTVNAMLGQVIIGEKSFGGTGTGLGTLSTGNAGTIDAQSILLGVGTGSGTFNFNGGVLIADDISRGTGSGTFNWFDGTLHVDRFGAPALPLALNNTGLGTLSPGLNLGRTDVYGAYTQGAAAGLHIDVGGLTQGVLFDTVQISGAATLAGKLGVGLANGFVPSAGNAFEVVRAATVGGQFGSLDLPTLPGGLQWSVDYQPSSVLLRVQAASGADVTSVLNLDSRQVLNFDALGNATLLADASDGMTSPIGAAYDAAGNLYVTDFVPSKVLRVAPNGATTTFADLADGVLTPVGIAQGHDGSLVAANYLAGSIVRIDSSGNGSIVADASDGIGQPFDVAVAPDGSLYVADIDGRQILHIDALGNVSVFADTGDGLLAPISVVVDASSNVFVADALTSVIYKFNPAGAGAVFASLADGIVGPTGLNFDDHGNLLVANYLGNTLVRLDAAGNATVLADASDGLDGPFDVAVGYHMLGPAPAGRLTQVPEPASIWLLAFGAALLAWRKVRTHATNAK